MATSASTRQAGRREPAAGPHPTSLDGGCCRLTTFAWTGAGVETCARLGRGDRRVYVRLPGMSAAVGRIWNTSSVRVVPCTPGGHPTGPPMDGTARVLADHENAPARRALAGGREWPRLPGDDEVLYVEIVPAAS